jgi:hypothetical protein
MILDHSIVAADFNSFGLKKFQVPSQWSICQCEQSDYANFTVLLSFCYSWKWFLGYLLSLAWQFAKQIHLVFPKSNLLSSWLALSWFANFVASSNALFSAAFCFQLIFFSCFEMHFQPPIDQNAISIYTGNTAIIKARLNHFHNARPILRQWILPNYACLIDIPECKAYIKLIFLDANFQSDGSFMFCSIFALVNFRAGQFTRWETHALIHLRADQFMRWLIYAVILSRTGQFTPWFIYALVHLRAGPFTRCFIFALLHFMRWSIYMLDKFYALIHLRACRFMRWFNYALVNLNYGQVHLRTCCRAGPLILAPVCFLLRWPAYCCVIIVAPDRQ